MPIRKDIQTQIEKYIETPLIQNYLVKALDYKLTDKDIDTLYNIGNTKGFFPRLYYLCVIYIHPLTHAQYIIKEASKIT